MSKRAAEDNEDEGQKSKKPKLEDEGSGSEDEVSGEDSSEDEIDEDELAALREDIEEAGVNTVGRRTRGVKIDYTGKMLPGEKEGEVDDEDDEDGDAEAKDGEPTGKGKEKPVSKAGASAKPASKLGAGSKPSSKVGGAGPTHGSKA